MGLGPAAADNKDNIYENAELDIVIRDRGKGTKAVDKAINSS